MGRKRVSILPFSGRDLNRMTGLRKRQHALMPKPGSPLWLRVFMAALFIFSANFVPLHLALESHLDDDHLLASRAGRTKGQPSNAVRAEAEDGDHHAPHFASDHLLRLAPRTPSSSVSLDPAAIDTNVLVFSPQPQTPLFLTERQNPPGLPPPDPLQPRAPPFA